jgi:hypothetical protein
MRNWLRMLQSYPDLVAKPTPAHAVAKRCAAAVGTRSN